MTLWIVVAVVAGMFFGRPIAKGIGFLAGFVGNTVLLFFTSALRMTLGIRSRTE